MENVINLLTNNGIGIFCVGYIIYFQENMVKTLIENQNKTNKILQKISRILTGKEVEEDEA